jgi:hypothetical protein
MFAARGMMTLSRKAEKAANGEARKGQPGARYRLRGVAGGAQASIPDGTCTSPRAAHHSEKESGIVYLPQGRCRPEWRPRSWAGWRVTQRHRRVPR